MKWIAHRGYNAKDNTRQAFQNAVIHGFDMLELDIHSTVDYKLILHHDPIMNNHIISKTEYKTLQTEDPDLLTLEEYFTYFSPSIYPCYIDIKGSNLTAILLLRYLLDKKIPLKKIIIASFNMNHLHTFIHNNIKVRLAFITCNVFTRKQMNNLLYCIDYIVVDWTILSTNLIDYANRNDKEIIAYTCNSNEIYHYINQYPTIYGIMSDIIFLDKTI